MRFWHITVNDTAQGLESARASFIAAKSVLKHNMKYLHDSNAEYSDAAVDGSIF